MLRPPGSDRPRRLTEPALALAMAALLLAMLGLLLGGCGGEDGARDEAGAGAEGPGRADLAAGDRGRPEAIRIEPQLLPLTGPITSPEAEISALCWCGDNLVIVPQHPERFGTAPGELGLFLLPRQEILDVIERRRREPLVPRPLVLEAPLLIESLPGWDGLEAAAAVGDTIYLAVETQLEGRMGGVLLRGQIVPVASAAGDGASGNGAAGDGSADPALCAPERVRVDTKRLAPIPLPTALPNMSQEALVLAPGRIAVLFEANGMLVNPGAHVALFDTELEYRGNVALEHVEYRITDATAADAGGRFWVINYFFPEEAELLQPPVIPAQPVEQLIELQLSERRVVRTASPGIDLRRDPDLPARNWEALVRLDGHGFLLMTDRYPGTLLAFVPYP